MFLLLEQRYPFSSHPEKFQILEQLRNIIRSGFMIEGQLSFNIFAEAPS